MIGRGACGKPWFLRQVIHFLRTGERLPDPGLAEQRDILLEHYEAMLNHYGIEAGVRVARKHLGWYARGFPGAAEFRNRVMKFSDPAAVRAAINEAWDAALSAGSARAAA
jgi:tRNA-dihydrouridine synthase B